MKAIVLLFASVLLAPLVSAQTPDCLPPAFLAQGNGTFGGNLGYFDNRTLECQTWTVAYQSDGGLTGFTIAFQYAQGANTPGSFSSLTPVSSSASFGTAQYGVATFNVLSTTSGDSIAAPFVHISLTGATGTGSIRLELYGYRTGPTGGTGGGGGGGGGTGCPNPCPVVGTGTAGSPDANPVTIQGITGATKVPVVIGASSTSTFSSGQQAVTATAANLGTATAQQVCVEALIANSINVYLGGSGVTTATGMEVPPGSVRCWVVNNSNLIYVVASTTGASVSFTVTD